jgi:GGDEF domain-containing protein
MSEYLNCESYAIILGALLLLSLYYNYRFKKSLRERLEGDAALIKSAYFNEITQLPNKNNIEIVIGEQIDRSHRHEKPFLVTVIKVLNYNKDTILELSNRIVTCTRDEDIVGHIEDDTFLILFNEYLEEENYSILYERMKKSFSKDDIYDVIIGKSQYPEDSKSVSGLIEEALRDALK